MIILIQGNLLRKWVIFSVGNIMTEERKYQEMLQRIRGFRLLDDDFMTKCFEENIEATELVLRIVLNKPDIKVIKVQTQYSMKNMKGRSLRLDIYATDSENKKYNIEIQRADKEQERNEPDTTAV